MNLKKLLPLIIYSFLALNMTFLSSILIVIFEPSNESTNKSDLVSKNLLENHPLIVICIGITTVFLLAIFNKKMNNLHRGLKVTVSLFTSLILPIVLLAICVSLLNMNT